MATRRTSPDTLRVRGTVEASTAGRFDAATLRRALRERLTTGVPVRPVRPEVAPSAAEAAVLETPDRTRVTDAVDVVVALKSRVEVLEAALDAARRMRESRPVEAALNARLEELRRLPDTPPEVAAGEVAVRAVGTPDDGGPVPLPGLTVSVLIGDQEVARGYTDASGVARVELPEHPERARGYEVRLLGPDDEQLTRARGSSLEGGAHVMEAAPTAALKRSFRAGLGYRKGLAAAEAEAKAIAESSALELEARAARLEKSIEIVRGGIVRVLGGE